MQTHDKSNPFKAFRSRNYTLFFCGQSTSQIGTWMQRTAVSWVVFATTHSASMLGVAVFAQQFPSFLFSLWGGIVSDRYDRRKILLITQSISLLQSAVLAVLTATGHYVIWEILALSAVLGIVNAFDTSARNPMVHELVTNKEDIPNAMALNSAMVNMARLIGPALSGIVLHVYGAHTCFTLNAISFLAVIASLLLMKLPKFEISNVKPRAAAALSEGFTYLKHTPRIAIIILMMMSLAMFVLPYDTLIPVFAKVVFTGDARTFGYITSSVGLGSLIGSFFMASLKKSTNLSGILLVGVCMLGLGLIGFSFCRNILYAAPFGVIIGFAGLAPMTASMTIIQLESAAHMRGRMMSYIAMGYFGMLPLGSLLAGAVSQKISAPLTMLIQGGIALVIALVFRNYLRPERSPKDAVIVSEEMILEKA